MIKINANKKATVMFVILIIVAFVGLITDNKTVLVLCSVADMILLVMFIRIYIKHRRAQKERIKKYKELDI